MTEEPTYDDLKTFVQWTQSVQSEAAETIKRECLVFDDLGDPWQRLAFILYTDLCGVNIKSRRLVGEVL